ncbi:hypothetical protein EYF80_051008 [Liparis tanakae]|uniref:Uncharacterized protein n=1 Tax=Liparis tanakae TaxID=230148 RepID=A0A4Z2FDI0_9TELE|nr:hypothetical protein EYF80_051008 [Liparis tanakae]
MGFGPHAPNNTHPPSSSSSSSPSPSSSSSSTTSSSSCATCSPACTHRVALLPNITPPASISSISSSTTTTVSPFLVSPALGLLGIPGPHPSSPPACSLTLLAMSWHYTRPHSGSCFDCETPRFLMLGPEVGGALPDTEAPLLLLLLLLSQPSPVDPAEGTREGLTPGPIGSVIGVLGPPEY